MTNQEMAAGARECFRFGAFTLVPGQRLLLRGERRVALGSRAFDILAALLARAGEIVSTQQLLAEVWAGTVVDAGTLRVHIAALRRSLDDDAAREHCLQNVPGKGYRFVAPVERGTVAANGPEAAATAAEALAPAPGALSRHRLVGRDAVLASVQARLATQRCITVAGPGGIGKTSVALALVDALRSGGQDVAVIELAPVTDPALVVATFASALQTGVTPANPVGGLAAFLRQRKLVLAIDNCEHLLPALAPLIEELLGAAPGLRVLCTSREPLLVEGEWVHRLAPLPVPPAAATSAQDTRQYAAVRLFVERARAAGDGFDLSEQNVPAVADICRRLDGIPLAIELAAAGVGQVGAHNLATLLQGRLALVQQGRRSAAPRHQTLQATLDWSYQLLDEAERAVLERIALFRNPFPLTAVQALCAGQQGVQEAVAGLVARSLVGADVVGDEVEYRLLELTREYARARLEAAADMPALHRLHARHILAVLVADGEARDNRQAAEWLALYGRRIDDIRAALAWAAQEGEAGLAIALAAAAAPLWFAASLMADYRAVAERALALRAAGGDIEARDEMVVCEAHGHALWHTGGRGPDISATFQRALEIAESLGAVPHQLRSIWGLWLVCNSTGDYRGSAALAHRFGEVAERAGATATALTHERMLALGLHYHGQQAQALVHARRVLAHPATVNHTARNSGFQFDQRVAALTVLARILWLHGETDEALACAKQAVEEALRIDHALSLCYALANGCVPVAFWSGETELAGRWTALLLERANEHSLVFWQAFGGGYQLLVDRATDLQRHRHRPLASAADPGVSVLLLEIMCTIDADLADDWALERARSGAGGWCAPELLRIEAEQGLRSGLLGRPQAVELLRRAFALARAQGARAWESRCAASLARLLPGEAEGMAEAAAARA